MKKRILSLLLVAAITVASLVGCGQEEKPAKTESSKATSESKPTQESETKATEVAYEDLPTINILYSHGQDTDNDIWREVAMRIGAKINFIGADNDKYNAMVASGDGYDILYVKKAIVNDAVAGGNFVALDDLVAEPGSNIKKNIPDMIQYSKKYVSDETNALYVLPAEVMYTGQTVPAVTGSRGLLRWDLYADMGYPEINSADDYINVLADMQAKYPTAPDGSKVYGMAIPSNMLLFTILKPAQFWAGHDVISNFSVVSYNYDMEFINIYSDEGAYWKGIDFFHKAYLKGLLDPDSFTLTENDMKKKATDGKLLYITAVYNVGDMPEGQGFMTLPNNWGGHDQSETPIAAKIANPPSWIAINKKSDKIDLCKKYLEFVYSEEGVNLVYNGIEGTHYTVENGVRVMTPEAKELYKDQAAWTEAGLGTTSVGHFMGINKSAVMSDGVTAFVALDDSNFKDSLTPVQQDFCEHYGVDYPSQIYFKYTEEYKLPDLGDVDPYVKAFLPVAEGEIVQLQAAVIAEAESLMAGLIMASEDEYEAKIAEAKKRFEKAGLPEVDAYFKANWQSAFDKAAEFKK